MLLDVVEFIKDMLKYIIIIAVIILIRIYVLTTAEVIGTSMEPNYTDGNILLVEQISQHFDNYKRFDVVVFKYSSPSYLIKRVIGLPGEKIRYTDNKLYVNDKLVNEAFNRNGVTKDFEVTVPNNMYYVLGDNRINSEDSRYFGPIKEKDIIGKPIITIWPISNIKLVK